MTNPSGGPRFTGAVVLAVGGLIDVVTGVLAMVGPAEDAPPTPVLVLIVLAGLVSAAGLLGSRAGLIAAYVARVVSAGLGIPAFFLDAPLWVDVLVALGLVLSVVGIVMTVPSLRRSAPATS